MHGRILALILHPLSLLALALIAAAVVYYPGLSGGFVFDSTTSIVLNERLKLEQLDLASLKIAALSDNAGALKRPLSMLSFAVNYYCAGGFDPRAFKTVNLGIHLLNGVSLYLFLSLLLTMLRRRDGNHDSRPQQSRWLAATVTAAWLLHPLAVTSVLYDVQRMNSLATLFILWGLISYLHGRQRLDNGHHKAGLLWIVAGIAGCGVLATLSKENGALLPLYALAMEATLFRFRTNAPVARSILIAVFVVFVALPLTAVLIYFVSHPGWITNQYIIRGFTLSERLLTETRILWWYLKSIVAPSYSELGLFHDDIPVSTGLLQPLTTVFAVLGLLLLSLAAYLARRRMPLVTFGILWFFVGHSLESSFLALELAHEHRNYLPMVGVLLMVFHAIFSLASTPKRRYAASAVAIALLLLFASVTALRAEQWGSSLRLSLTEIRHHPDSVRANYEAGRSYMVLFEGNRTQRTYFDQAKHYLTHSTELDDRSTIGFFGLIYLAHLDGSRPDPAMLDELTHRFTFTNLGAYDNLTLSKLASVDGKGQPVLAHQHIVALFEAAIANPNLQPAVRGVFLSNLSAYYANQRRDYPTAAALAIKAIEAAPRQPALYVSFANLLVALHQYPAAREQLQIARSMRPGTVVAKEIDETERALEIAEKTSPTTRKPAK